MGALRVRCLFALLVLGVGLSAPAQEPGPKSKKDVELLPLPKQMDELLPPPQIVPQPGNLLFPYVPPQLPRWGTREVWQFYGVDGAGRFRPRVILAPYGAYYAVNGAPYPWTTSRPMLYMPYVTD